jgi:hypothetical protein
MLEISGAPCLSRGVGHKNTTRYQLALQFRGDSLADYDQMIALEDRLIEDLGRSAEVDGHDCGSGIMPRLGLCRVEAQNACFCWQDVVADAA